MSNVQCPCPHIVAKHSQLNRRAKKKPAQTKQPKWNETKSNGNTHLIKYALIIIASCCWVIMAEYKGKKKIVLAICYFTEAFRKPHHFDGSRKLLKKTIQWYFFIYFFNGCNYFQLQAFVKFQLRPSSIWFWCWKLQCSFNFIEHFFFFPKFYQTIYRSLLKIKLLSWKMNFV